MIDAVKIAVKIAVQMAEANSLRKRRSGIG